MNGIIRSYNVDRKFGLINPLVGDPNKSAPVFFHLSTCLDGVAPPRGAEVTFKLCRGPEGQPQAFDVRILEVKLAKPGTP